jgi:hypothetical protein
MNDQQPPNAYGQQPQAVPQPPKRSRTWRWILLGAAGLVVLGCGILLINLMVGGDSSKDGGGGQGGQAPAPSNNPGIGDPVRDGKFEFVVTKAECGVNEVGTGISSKRPQGQFCLVTLSVRNIGDKPQTLSDSDQKGIGTNGSEYSTDTVAGTYANDSNSQVWLTEINPGNQVTGILAYDLPKDVDLAKLELHDSLFSGGVMVDLK